VCAPSEPARGTCGCMLLLESLHALSHERNRLRPAPPAGRCRVAGEQPGGCRIMANLAPQHGLHAVPLHGCLGGLRATHPCSAVQLALRAALRACCQHFRSLLGLRRCCLQSSKQCSAQSAVGHTRSSSELQRSSAASLRSRSAAASRCAVSATAAARSTAACRPAAPACLSPQQRPNEHMQCAHSIAAGACFCALQCNTRGSQSLQFISLTQILHVGAFLRPPSHLGALWTI
jgi:hypothetical protein